MIFDNIDKIYIVSYVKNDELRANIAYQLYYHGITNFEFYYTYDISENIINNPNSVNIKHYSASYAHYDIMKRSYELGYNRIIVFEDDVMFLKDKIEFKNVLFDAINRCEDIVFVDYKIENRQYSDANIIWIALQSGYIVNKNGMQFYIQNFEKTPQVIDHYLNCKYVDDKLTLMEYGILWLVNGNIVCHYLENLNTTIYYSDTRLCYQKNLLYNDPSNDTPINQINKDKYFNL